MRQSRSIGKEPNFSRIILFSAILHLLFIILVVIPMRARQEEFKSYRVTLVGPLQAPRAVKDTPATGASVKDTKGRTAPVKETAKPLPKTDMSLESFEQMKKKEIERLRALKALSEKQAVSKRIQEIRVGRKSDSDKILPGPGVPGPGTGTETDLYYSMISEKIWQHWSYPNPQASGLEVVVSIKIAKSGKVISREIEKPSGNTLFDRSAIRAIEKASPLPPPPGEIEIGVRFYL